MRKADIKEWAWYNEDVTTLTKLYCMVLYYDTPTTPGVCQRLEQIIFAEQIAPGHVVGSQLTSKDYILQFFYGGTGYIDSNNEPAISHGVHQGTHDLYTDSTHL